MALSKPEQLVFDTLHFRSNSGSCFVTNEPGLRLIASDASHLPVVQSALIKLSRLEEWNTQNGLDYLIGAFLVLSTKYAPNTTVEFIQNLPHPFTTKIVAVIPVFFNRAKNGDYNFGVPLPHDLLEYVKSMAACEEFTMRKKAERALKFLTQEIDETQ